MLNLYLLTVKLDSNPNLKAGKPSAGCVEVKWNQPESGACFIKYEIQFKNASADVIATRIEYNTGSITVCSFKVNITNVDFTISFKAAKKNFTAKVSENPIPTTPAPTTKPTTAGETSFTVLCKCALIQ